MNQRKLKLIVLLTAILGVCAITSERSVSAVAVPGALRFVSATPAVVSDHQAYSMLFQMIAAIPDGVSSRSAQALMRHIGLGRGCKTCGQSSPSTALQAEPDLEQFTLFIRDFGRELNEINRSVAAVTGIPGGPRANRSVPDLTPEARQQLRALAQQKGALVDRYAVRLPQVIGHDAASRIATFVETKFKPHIKVK